jgi:hypothetical protein
VHEPEGQQSTIMAINKEWEKRREHIDVRGSVLRLGILPV